LGREKHGEHARRKDEEASGVTRWVGDVKTHGF